MKDDISQFIKVSDPVIRLSPFQAEILEKMGLSLPVHYISKMDFAECGVLDRSTIVIETDDFPFELIDRIER